MKRVYRQPTKQATNHQQSLINVPCYQVSWLKEWKAQLKQQIFQTVQLRQTIASREEPQRCLVHNIALSVYCTLCRKTLCASCMYTSATHRKHRVTPIESAKEQLKDDIRNYEQKINKTSTQIEGLLGSNAHLLVQIDKKISTALRVLKQFYEELAKYLKIKEQEHIQIMKEFQQNSKAQIITYNRELNNLNTYITNKTKFCLSYKAQTLVSSRSILQVLMLSSKFISDSLLDPEQYTPPTQPQRIRRIASEIEDKLSQILAPHKMKPVQVPINKASHNRSVSRSIGKMEPKQKGIGLRGMQNTTSMRTMQHRRSVI